MSLPQMPSSNSDNPDAYPGGLTNADGTSNVSKPISLQNQMIFGGFLILISVSAAIVYYFAKRGCNKRKQHERIALSNPPLSTQAGTNFDIELNVLIGGGHNATPTPGAVPLRPASFARQNSVVRQNSVARQDSSTHRGGNRSEGRRGSSTRLCLALGGAADPRVAGRIAEGNGSEATLPVYEPLPPAYLPKE